MKNVKKNEFVYWQFLGDLKHFLANYYTYVYVLIVIKKNLSLRLTFNSLRKFYSILKCKI